MEVADLSFFLAVARAGGVTRASKELLTVQSNISSRIRALEGELGVELFRRHARGMNLTHAGELLVPYAERVTQLIREVTQIVGDEANPLGRLNIGSMESTAGLRLPKVLSAFSAECPRVELSLVTDTTEALIAKVLDHRLDGAFVCGPVGHPDLVCDEVFVEQLVVASGPQVDDLEAVFAGQMPLKALVLRAGCAYRTRLEWILDQRDVPGPEILEFASLEGILGCVAAGMGITLLPIGVVMASQAASMLNVHRLPEAQARVQTLFIRRADATMTPAMTRFVAHTRELDQQEPQCALEHNTIENLRRIS
ncbi:LysR substrate-binding domain-containing protein [Mycobacterium simiae]|uniref:Probable hydrogen peroxide-inducible genes activator n=1 Tax=Mycobacterium simiae TaxID=1784 RepID=A0A1X0XZB1_MYCSI|nr:LysR substrate-binding domain-containing protein [Mycobacterium simiae]ORJ58148.1 LysR family transcriptional regulator [Mycobacterium simiae]